jgi:hypothetical protein
LEYFHANSDSYSLRAQVTNSANLTIAIKNWNEGHYAWEQIATSYKGKLVYRINGLKPAHPYEIIIDERVLKTIKSSAGGDLEFTVPTKNSPSMIKIQLLNN